MGCTHPFGYDEIRGVGGELVGIRCKSCGMTSYKGDTFWTSMKWAVLTGIFGRRRP